MSILKRQSVAWVIAILMILFAIGFGLAKAPVSFGPETDTSDYELVYVYDDAQALSLSTVLALSERNQQLLDELDVAIAVVTCDYGGPDLGGYALDYAEDIGLGPNDFIVVLDISGENYWLVQGADLVDQFTDQDCSDYAWDYMEADFAAGDYDSAAIRLMDALCRWYDTQFVG